MADERASCAAKPRTTHDLTFGFLTPLLFSFLIISTVKKRWYTGLRKLCEVLYDTKVFPGAYIIIEHNYTGYPNFDVDLFIIIIIPTSQVIFHNYDFQSV